MSSSKDFLPHDQENYLTWGLDFDYDPNANSDLSFSG